jgi:hypothetical protein
LQQPGSGHERRRQFAWDSIHRDCRRAIALPQSFGLGLLLYRENAQKILLRVVTSKLVGWRTSVTTMAEKKQIRIVAKACLQMEFFVAGGN